jgi:hypothetical protein
MPCGELGSPRPHTARPTPTTAPLGFDSAPDRIPRRKKGATHALPAGASRDRDAG